MLSVIKNEDGNYVFDDPPHPYAAYVGFLYDGMIIKDDASELDVYRDDNVAPFTFVEYADVEDQTGELSRCKIYKFMFDDPPHDAEMQPYSVLLKVML